MRVRFKIKASVSGCSPRYIRPEWDWTPQRMSVFNGSQPASLTTRREANRVAENARHYIATHPEHLSVLTNIRVVATREED